MGPELEAHAFCVSHVPRVQALVAVVSKDSISHSLLIEASALPTKGVGRTFVPLWPIKTGRERSQPLKMQA